MSTISYEYVHPLSISSRSHTTAKLLNYNTLTILLLSNKIVMIDVGSVFKIGPCIFVIGGFGVGRICYILQYPVTLTSCVKLMFNYMYTISFDLIQINICKSL